MKNLTHLSDDRLLSDVKALCADERRITTEILQYLLEIDSRKSYLDLGYGSLFEFTVKELKYSEGSAARRISAMKLMRQCPEVKEEIQTGSLSVTTVSLAKRATEGRPIEEKKEVLLSLQNLSQREVEQVLADRYPEKVQVEPEKEKVLPGGSTQITFTVSKELMEKLERLKEIFSHQSLDPSLSELLEIMANQLLKKLDPKHPSSSVTSTPVPAKHCSTNPDYIPASIQRAVRQRDQNRCTWVSPRSGLRCSSRKLIQFDHIVEKARTAQLENSLGGFELRFLDRCIANSAFSKVCGFRVRKVLEQSDLYSKYSLPSSLPRPDESGQENTMCAFLDGIAARKGQRLGIKKIGSE